MTWNCCWKLRDKLPTILLEAPDIAVLQECSQRDLEDLPSTYKGQWLCGDPSHGLGMIYREPITTRTIKTSELLSFAAIEVSGALDFTLIAVWNCKEGKSNYPEHLHQFLDEHIEWFEKRPVVLAGDLNSQAGASFDIGKRRHAQFEQRLRELGLIDAQQFAGTPQPTYRHRRSEDSLFCLDYIFIPEEWISKVSSLTVGSHSVWSEWSDHSPIILTIAE